MAPYARGRYACSPPHGPRTTAHGPLLQRRETRLTDGFPVTRFVLLQCRETRRSDGFPVTRLMLFEQAVAHQKRDATLAHFDRRDHSYTP